jgi:hypothetical protein
MFTELLKATISLVISVFCPLGTAWHTMDGFSLNFMFEEFWKICQENSGFIKI